MNKQLQTTNEELHTMNDELRKRSDDLNTFNAFLGTVLSVVRDGLIIVDRAGQITAWNPGAEELWGLRASEIQGMSFLSLNNGLPIEELGGFVRAALSGESQTGTVHVVDRRGKSIACTVQVTPVRSPMGGAIEGAVLLIQPKDA